MTGEPTSTLTLSMIVKNEEKFLRGCLESVRDVVDEIVVVDTGSTDKTMDIAKEFDAKVFLFDWINDFSAARNESLLHATGDWILYLDADERLRSGQKKKLRQLLSQNNVHAFDVWIEGGADLKDGCVAQRNAYPRLFRSHPSVRFEGRVHEQITPSLERIGWSIHPSDLVIDHLGYAQGFDTVTKKAQRNCEILKKQIEDEPNNAYAMFQYGNTLSILGKYDDAYRAVQQSLTSQQLSSSVSASAFNLITEMEIRNGQFVHAIDHATQSLTQASNQTLARWFLAVAYTGCKDYSKALAVLGELKQLQRKRTQGTVPAFDVNVERWKILYQQGICFEGLQEYEHAVEAFLAALREEPELETVLPKLSNALFHAEPHAAWIDSLKSVLQKYPSHLELTLLLADQLWGQRRTQQAFDLLQKCQCEHVQDLRAYSKEIEWALTLKDNARITAALQRAEAFHRQSYVLFKIAIDGSLRSGDLITTLSYLEWMLTSVPEQIPMQILPKMKSLTTRLKQLSEA
ncbi:MAG TPA: glycosyltransferase [Bacteroidota bacterium]|nr:glycosyltransferase [Bacteroidota bacterium]